MAIFRGTGGQGDSTTDTTVTTVTQKAAEAASSATSAANSATSASNSATSASTSATNAATSKTNAANSATASATSATASETAKTASQAAQTAAETAQANAETAEANAVTAKNQAVSAKDNAVTAQTAAETAETNAETAYANTLAIYGSTTDVQNAVDSASASATTATTKASEAATSATNAANSATSAGTSETNAASSASQAATSASSANSYATDAQTAQTAAETAQAAAEAAEYNINGLYLGSLANDPTLDGNGVAVTTGDLYFNTTEQEVRVYTDGDVWIPVQELSGDQTVNSLTSNNNVVVKGNLEVQGTTITVNSATAQTIDLGDNDKIRLGDGDDLQIYHDGTKSYISDQGTGNLKIIADNLVLTNAAETNTYFVGDGSTGGVNLKYGNATKFDTTSSGVDITGNITVSGTVDGRDIAADGTTLDAVASTYVDVSGDTLTGDLAFGDNVKAKFGASDDLEIYHDGSNSYVSDQGTGNLYLQGTSGVVLESATGDNYLYGLSGGEVALYHNNSIKAITTSSGVDITGTVVADDLLLNNGSGSSVFLQDSTGTNGYQIRANVSSSADYGLLAEDLAGKNLFEIHSGGDVKFYEDTGTTAKLTWDASAEELQFKDNVKAEFGDGGDLQILHNSTNSQILNNTGVLQIIQESGSDIVLNSNNGSGGTTTYFRADGSTGESILYHYGSQKLATKSTGIDVTGTVTADGLTVDGTGDLGTIGNGAFNETAALGFQSDRAFFGYSSGQYALIQSGASKAVAIEVNSDTLNSGTRSTLFSSNGDISFYDDSGSSQDLYWDASTSRLGLGTTSPTVKLDVEGVVRAATGSEYTDLKYYGVEFNRAASYIRPDTDGTKELFIGWDGVNRAWNNIYLNSTTSTRFYAGASEAMRIDSSGNVGIGTTSPEAPLEIAYSTSAPSLEESDAGFLLSANNTLRTIFGADPLSPYAHWIQVTNSSGSAAFPLALNPQGGNVGIGATALTSYNTQADDLVIKNASDGGITIHSGTASTGNIFFADGTTGNEQYRGWVQYDHSTDHLAFGTAGTEVARIDSSGRLGIGTTSPAYTLDVSGSTPTIRIKSSSDNDTSLLDMRTTATYSNESKSIIKLGSPSTGSVNNNEAIAWHIEASEDESGFPQRGYALKFIQDERIDASTTQEVEAMRLTSDGRLGIGTTSPSQALHVNAGTVDAVALFESTDNTARIQIKDNGGTANVQVGNGNLQLMADVDDSVSGSRIQFFVDGTSEVARFDSSGRLLIGRTTGTSLLYVNGTGADIAINDNASTYGYRQTTLKVTGDRFLLQTRNGDGSFVSQDYIIDKGSSGATSHQWLIDGAEAARIDSSGRLGIGTTSPSFKLEVAGDIATRASTNASVYVISGGTTNQSRVYFGDDDSQIRGRLIYDHSNDSLQTFVSGSERMRIDSSGRLGIGTTSPASPLQVDRASTDGDIVTLSKDGTTVGSIGVDNTDNIFLSGNSTHSGLMVGTESIVPYSNGATTDATEDLGASSIRWRNLYLSGGVYLGGTGSANLLDDYEEGTWTPVVTHVSGFASTSITQTHATYTKVGRKVTLQLEFSLTDSTGNVTAGDDIVLTAACLPFSVLEGGIAGGVVGVQASMSTGENLAMGYAGFSSGGQLGMVFHTVDGTVARNQGLGGTVTYFTS